MAAETYAPWLESAIGRYADYLVVSGRASADTAMDVARRTHAGLHPQGLETPGHYLFDIRCGSHTVGTVWAHLGPEGRAYLYDLHVAPEHRRQGHARQALAVLATRMALLGATQLGLNVEAGNSAARRLYEEMGFQTHSLQMSRRLGNVTD